MIDTLINLLPLYGYACFIVWLVYIIWGWFTWDEDKDGKRWNP